ncbi:MAG: carbamate kinase [Anaerolineales bacterium]|nr:carbamate kinase [Anaerolineales bacterium]
MSKLALVAIGGNSLITDNNSPEVSHQWDAVRETCKHLADMTEMGWQLIITHGNGPQAGFILRRNELATSEVHTTPLDIIVADTQGSIGYMLQQGLKNELFQRNIRKKVVSVVTQVLVKKDDPAFAHPSKPIGGFMSEAEAQVFVEAGWQVVEDSGRGWRRVVASPQPRRIIEKNSIKDLLQMNNIVIACGGGGIPVVHNHKGELRELSGVFAVIDKDRASSLLAQNLHADLFLISTAVPCVSLNYGKPNQQDLHKVTAKDLKKHLADKQFAPGSMQPKIEAALDFVNATGNTAVITNPPNIAATLAGNAGTWIVKHQLKNQETSR